MQKSADLFFSIDFSLYMDILLLSNLKNKKMRNKKH